MMHRDEMPPAPIRTRILAALQAGPLTTMALADAIDASPSVRAAGIRHALRRLQKAGAVRVVDRIRRQGLPAVVWGLA